MRRSPLLTCVLVCCLLGVCRGPPVWSAIKPDCLSDGMQLCLPLASSGAHDWYWEGGTSTEYDVCKSVTRTSPQGVQQKCLFAPLEATVDGQSVTNPCGSTISQDNATSVITIENVAAIPPGTPIFGGAESPPAITARCYYQGSYDVSLTVQIDNEANVTIPDLPPDPGGSWDFDKDCKDKSPWDAPMNCTGRLDDGRLIMEGCEESAFMIPYGQGTNLQNFSIVIAVEVYSILETRPQPLLYLQPQDAAPGEGTVLLEALLPSMQETPPGEDRDPRCPAEITDTTICAAGVDVSRMQALFCLFNSETGLRVLQEAGSDPVYTDPDLKPVANEGDWIYLWYKGFAEGCVEADREPPEVRLLSPPHEAENVTLDSDVLIVFNEEIRENGGALRLSSEEESFQVVISPLMVLGAALVVPLKRLLPNMVYEVLLTEAAVADTVGNAAAAVRWRFTTADGDIDNSGPYLLYNELVPRDGSVDVDPKTSLFLPFSEPILPAQGNIVFKPEPISRRSRALQPSVGLDPPSLILDLLESLLNKIMSIAGNVLTISPPFAFPPDQLITVVLPPGLVKDPAGNLSPKVETFSFTTKANDDTTPPDLERDVGVSALAPDHEETGVLLALDMIQMRFDEPIVVAASNAAITLTPLTAGGPVVVIPNDPSFYWVMDNDVRFFLPESRVLLPLAEYRVDIPYGLIRDEAGNIWEQESFEWRFTFEGTVDDKGPVPLPQLAIPRRGSIVAMTQNDIMFPFDEPIVRGRGSIFIYDKRPGAAFSIAIDIHDQQQVSISDNLLFIAPSLAYPSVTDIELQFPPGLLTDPYGNPSEPLPPNTYSFRTQRPLDLTAPKAVGFTPLPDSENAPLVTPLVVTYDIRVLLGTPLEEIRIVPSTPSADKKRFYIRIGEEGNSDDGHAEALFDVLVITPSAPFAAGTTYTVTVPLGAVKSVEGISSNEQAVWQFTTVVTPPEATGDPFEPVLTVPANEDQNVAVTTNVLLHYSMPVALNRLAGSDGVSTDPPGVVQFVPLSPASDTLEVPLISVLVVDKTVIIDPPRDLKPSTNYQFNLPAEAFVALTETSPATVSAAFDMTFTTSGQSDTEAPPIDTGGTYPPRDGTDVPPDAPIVIPIPEPILPCVNDGKIIIQTPPGQPYIEIPLNDSNHVIIEGSTIVIIPPEPLPPNSQIIVKLPACTGEDENGNETPEKDIEFPTGEDNLTTPEKGGPDDETNPGVTAILPANGSVDVSTEVDLNVIFTEKVEVVGGVLLVVATDGRHVIEVPLVERGVLATGVSLLADDVLLKIILPEPLRSGTKYEVFLPANTITDPNDNPFGGFGPDPPGQEWTFTTVAPSVYGNPPQFVGIRVDPENDRVILEFDQPVQRGDGQTVVIVPTGPDPPTKEPIVMDLTDPEQVIVVGTTVILDPPTILPSDTSFTLKAPEGLVQNPDGLPNAAFEKEFDSNTLITEDFPRPAVSSLRPRPLEPDVSVSTSVSITFDRDIVVTPGAQFYFSNMEDGQPTGGQIIDLEDPSMAYVSGPLLVIKPPLHFPQLSNISASFSSGAIEGTNGAGFDLFTATVTAHDGSQILFSDYVFYTGVQTDEQGPTTGDPEDIGKYPKPPFPPVDPGNTFPPPPYCIIPPPFSYEPDLVETLTGSDNPPPITIICIPDFTLTFPVNDETVRIEGEYLLICPPEPLPPLSDCKVTIGNGTVEDEAGNPNGGEEIDFETPDNPDKTPPQLIEELLRPKKQSVNVPTDVSVVLVFNEDVRVSSSPLTYPAALTVEERTNGDFVDARVLPVTNDMIIGATVVINPLRFFPGDKEIRVGMEEGLFVDYSGNQAASYKWTFRTAAKKDNDGPNAVVYLPSDGATDVPVIGTSLVIMFDEDVAPGEGEVRVTASQVNNPGLPFDQSFAVDINDPNQVKFAGRTVTISLVPMLDNTLHEVSIADGVITDRQGNDWTPNSPGPLNWQFTTVDIAYPFDPLAPQVLLDLVYPKVNEKNVSIATVLVVVLDDPVVPGKRPASPDEGTIRLMANNTNVSDVEVDATDTSTCRYGNPPTMVMCEIAPLNYSILYNVTIVEGAFLGLEKKLPSEEVEPHEWNFTTRVDPMYNNTNNTGGDSAWDGGHWYNDTLNETDLPDPDIIFVEDRGTFKVLFHICADPTCSGGGQGALYKYGDKSQTKYYYGAETTASGFYPVFKRCVADPVDKSVVESPNTFTMLEEHCAPIPNVAAWEHHSMQMWSWASTHSFTFSGYTTVYLTCDITMCLDPFCGVDCPASRRALHTSSRSLQGDGFLPGPSPLALGPLFGPPNPVLVVGDSGAIVVPPPDGSGVDKDGGKDEELTTLVVIFCVVGALLLVSVVGWFCYRRWIKSRSSAEIPHPHTADHIDIRSSPPRSPKAYQTLGGETYEDIEKAASPELQVLPPMPPYEHRTDGLSPEKIRITAPEEDTDHGGVEEENDMPPIGQTPVGVAVGGHRFSTGVMSMGPTPAHIAAVTPTSFFPQVEKPDKPESPTARRAEKDEPEGLEIDNLDDPLAYEFKTLSPKSR
ncbi:unnamed protein product [Vitrella brassicaformis CCMP3155]|uniref:SbsA Ig-like domain-containing protein n=3 Tax=Vitrella brassicaformis TaxID=1169539 RepID=A0A0G4E9L0_VITBC|nr:unnamed protein product [Vitrella brassicaformis CCMP3155]|eukprot:CEL92098.1 unnamed protein product [Vitrella brassicaformis CCMP3155]